jgi:hypothetical protein
MVPKELCLEDGRSGSKHKSVRGKLLTTNLKGNVSTFVAEEQIA